jgi:hypothetical protein
VSIPLGEGHLAVVDDRYRCAANVVFVKPPLYLPIDERFEIAEVPGSLAVVAVTEAGGPYATRNPAGSDCGTSGTRSSKESAA